MVNGKKNHWNKSQNQQEKNRMKKDQNKKKRKIIAIYILDNIKSSLLECIGTSHNIMKSIITAHFY